MDCIRGNKPYNLYFSLLQFVNVAAAISIHTFLTIFLVEKGYSEVEVGLLVLYGLSFSSIIPSVTAGPSVQQRARKQSTTASPVGWGHWVALPEIWGEGTHPVRHGDAGFASVLPHSSGDLPAAYLCARTTGDLLRGVVPCVPALYRADYAGICSNRGDHV